MARPPKQLNPQTTFQKLLMQGYYRGQLAARSKAAREWYRLQARKTRANPMTLLSEEGARMVNKPVVGHMYLFNYDPKHKETLPYYDTFPLIFRIGNARRGFLGINLHYLPPKWRAQLMDALYSKVSNKNYDFTTKLQNIAYADLIRASKFNAFRPCIKHYLWDHVRSRFLKLHVIEWDIALFLPLARFKKATQAQVWADSRRIIREAAGSGRSRRTRRRRNRT